MERTWEEFAWLFDFKSQEIINKKMQAVSSHGFRKHFRVHYGNKGAIPEEETGITSTNCVLGTAPSYALLFPLVRVLCSYAYAYPRSLASVHAVPMNAKPNGIPGASLTKGSAGEAVIDEGWKPRGTESMI